MMRRMAVDDVDAFVDQLMGELDLLPRNLL